MRLNLVPFLEVRMSFLEGFLSNLSEERAPSGEGWPFFTSVALLPFPQISLIMPGFRERPLSPDTVQAWPRLRFCCSGSSWWSTSWQQLLIASSFLSLRPDSQRKTGLLGGEERLGHSDLDRFTRIKVQNWISLFFLGKTARIQKKERFIRTPSNRCGPNSSISRLLI